MMMRIFGQMMWLPVSLLARWMDLLAGLMQKDARAGGWQEPQAMNASTDAGIFGDNPWARGDGAANNQVKEERTMSSCCCDNDHGVVRLVEYTIVSIKRCDERILYKSEIIETEEMSDEAFATWVVALYLQEPGVHVPHADKKFLRVYHHVLQEWPRQQESCCEDRQVHVLRGIEEAIRGLTRHVGGGERPEGALS